VPVVVSSRGPAKEPCGLSRAADRRAAQQAEALPADAAVQQRLDGRAGLVLVIEDRAERDHLSHPPASPGGRTPPGGTAAALS